MLSPKYKSDNSAILNVEAYAGLTF